MLHIRIRTNKRIRLMRPTRNQKIIFMIRNSIYFENHFLNGSGKKQSHQEKQKKENRKLNIRKFHSRLGGAEHRTPPQISILREKPKHSFAVAKSQANRENPDSHRENNGQNSHNLVRNARKHVGCPVHTITTSLV